MLDGEADLAVHSAKDLPGDRPDELRLVGVHGRADPVDAYVGEASSLDEVPEGARVGTASLRRRSQLLALRPDLDVVELHGNVDTRLRKLSEGEFDGIVLAAAGLRRLAREAEIAFGFGLEELTPAAGQGSLALEARRDDPDAAAAAASISDHDALVELTAERAAVATLQATCHTPVGICARLDGGRVDDARVRGPAGRLGMGSGSGHGRPRAARRARDRRWRSGCWRPERGRSWSERRPPRDRGAIRRRLSGRSRARRSGPDDRAGRGADRRAPRWFFTTA